MVGVGIVFRLLPIDPIRLVFAGLRMVFFPRDFPWVHVYGGVGQILQAVQELMMHLLGDAMPRFHCDAGKDGYVYFRQHAMSQPADPYFRYIDYS